MSSEANNERFSPHIRAKAKLLALTTTVVGTCISLLEIPDTEPLSYVREAYIGSAVALGIASVGIIYSMMGPEPETSRHNPNEDDPDPYLGPGSLPDIRPETLSDEEIREFFRQEVGEA